MIVDITKLKSGIEEFVPFTFEKDFLKEELVGTDLLELKDVRIEGNISKNAIDTFDVDCSIQGTMVLACAITMKPVPYPFLTQVNGNLEEMLEEMNEFLKKTENTIDLFPIIWENILMEIPMKVVSEAASFEEISGEGWRLITEDSKQEEINPELQKLQKLLEEK